MDTVPSVSRVIDAPRFDTALLDPTLGDPALSDADLLHRLAQHLEAALFGPADDRPAGSNESGPFAGLPASASPSFLIAAERTASGLEVGFLPLEVHPAAELLGMRAPETWWCLGVISSGTARRLPDHVDDSLSATRWLLDSTDDDPGRPVHVLHLVSRSGDAISTYGRKGANPDLRWIPAAQRTDTGHIDDCCRRALGLPTAPPPSTTMAYWAGRWLEAVLADAASGRLDGAAWRDIARLHATGALVEGRAPGAVADWACDNLGRAGELLAERYDWPELLASERRRAQGDDRHLLEWMDEGFFARAELTLCPEPNAALADLAMLLPEHLVRRIAETLDVWGLLDRSGH